MPERNQNVSNNSNGTYIDRKTISHNATQNFLSTDHSLQFTLAFQIIQKRQEYLKMEIISNAPYCLLSHHLAMKKRLFHKEKILYRLLVS